MAVSYRESAQSGLKPIYRYTVLRKYSKYVYATTVEYTMPFTELQNELKVARYPATKVDCYVVRGHTFCCLHTFTNINYIRVTHLTECIYNLLPIYIVKSNLQRLWIADIHLSLIHI